MTVTIDCSGKTTRAINAELRAAISGGETDLLVQAPDARHNLAVALLQPVLLERRQAVPAAQQFSNWGQDMLDSLGGLGRTALSRSA